MQQKRILLILFFSSVLFSSKGFSAGSDSSSVKITGYADAYYAYYTDSVGDGKFQKFPSVCPRSNQFGLNTALLTVHYNMEKVRALATLHYGDIPVSAWSGTFNNIMEANVGVRLAKKFWLDAGFFRTHIGTEGLLPVENIASSISVPSYLEPYFESGVKLNYIPNDKLTINFLVLNGYNTFEDNNREKSVGVFVSYAFSDKVSLGYSNYIGDDTPGGADTVSHLRFFQNIFFNYQVKKLKMQLGIDHAVQEHADITDPSKSAMMLSGLLSLKFQFTKSYSLYTRGEMLNDPQGFMSGVITDRKNKLTGLSLFGVTAGAEYKPADNALIRLEARELITDKDREIFYWKGEVKNNRLEILLNMGISF